MDNTWAARDLPVLTFIVGYFDEHVESAPALYLEQIAEGIDLGVNDVKRAAALLFTASPPFIKGIEVDQARYPVRITGITERALRAVGQWPSPESVATALLEGLAEAAERQPTEEAKGRIRSMVGVLGGAGRDVLVDVSAAVISRQLGV